MELKLLTELLAQAPTAILVLGVWWLVRREYREEVLRLRDRIAQKDEMILEYTKTFRLLTSKITSQDGGND